MSDTRVIEKPTVKPTLPKVTRGDDFFDRLTKVVAGRTTLEPKQPPIQACWGNGSFCIQFFDDHCCSCCNWILFFCFCGPCP
jgi:hypothetical protein